MATITKLIRQSGVRYKAIIRHNGRILKTKTFKTKTAARTWAKRIENDQEMIDAYGLPGVGIKLYALADEYMMQWKGRDKSQSARVSWWVNEIGDKKLTDIDRHLIRDCLEAYYKGHALKYVGIDKHQQAKFKSTDRKRSPASFNRMRAALSALFKFAIQRGYVNTNPVHNVPSKTENNKRVRWLSDEERTRLLEACQRSKYDRMYLLVLMAITTGARRGELLSLRWSDINFNTKTATLHTTKNGDRRVLTLPTNTLEVLLNYREVGDSLLFRSKTHPKVAVPLNKYWYDVLDDAGINDFRFHDLRHTAASYLVMNGATLYEAGEVLGHKTTQTTKRYAHLSIEHKAQLTERIFSQILDDTDK